MCVDYVAVYETRDGKISYNISFTASCDEEMVELAIRYMDRELNKQEEPFDYELIAHLAWIERYQRDQAPTVIWPKFVSTRL